MRDQAAERFANVGSPSGRGTGGKRSVGGQRGISIGLAIKRGTVIEQFPFLRMLFQPPAGRPEIHAWHNHGGWAGLQHHPHPFVKLRIVPLAVGGPDCRRVAIVAGRGIHIKAEQLNSRRGELVKVFLQRRIRFEAGRQYDVKPRAGSRLIANVGTPCTGATLTYKSAGRIVVGSPASSSPAAAVNRKTNANGRRMSPCNGQPFRGEQGRGREWSLAFDIDAPRTRGIGFQPVI